MGMKNSHSNPETPPFDTPDVQFGTQASQMQQLPPETLVSQIFCVQEQQQKNVEHIRQKYTEVSSFCSTASGNIHDQAQKISDFLTCKKDMRYASEIHIRASDMDAQTMNFFFQFKTLQKLAQENPNDLAEPHQKVVEDLRQWIQLCQQNGESQPLFKELAQVIQLVSENNQFQMGYFEAVIADQVKKLANKPTQEAIQVGVESIQEGKQSIQEGVESIQEGKQSIQEGDIQE